MIDTVGLVRLYDQQFFPKLSPPPAAALRMLARTLHEDDKVNDRRWRAYILATVKLETGASYLPVTERGSAGYFYKYERGTKLGKRLGNTEAGDGFMYRGRGYIQITGRNNYTRMSDVLDVDLVSTPSLASEDEIAYKILTVGMVKGLFTGKDLADYFNSDESDWVGARRIVNGLDRATEIADDALKFYRILSKVENPTPIDRVAT